MELLRRVAVRNPASVIGAAVICGIIILALLAPLLAPASPVEQSIPDRLQEPSSSHWFGTDQYGRDVLSRVLIGARITIQVGIVVTSVALVLGLFLGLLSGYWLHSVDKLTGRLIEALLAVPSIVLAIGLVAALGAGTRSVIIALAVVYLANIARLVRGSVIEVRDRPFIQAARIMGANSARLVFRHVLPHVLSPAIVHATLIFAYAVLAEASLSFLGLGAPAPAPSWGNIMNDGRGYLLDAYWITLFPGLAITVTVLGINLLGDGLRDVLDPRMR